MPEPMSGCWLWLGCVGRYGHGKLTYKRRGKDAHRLVYELLVGEVPKGLVLDHRHCDNPSCVNPDHLLPSTYRQNTLRSKKTLASKFLERTHCKNGHPFSGDNLSSEPRSKSRICLACRKARSGYEKEWVKNNREKARAYTKKWRTANGDKVKEYGKRYRALNRAKVKASKREIQDA